jgi:hypothetical protein
MGAAVSNLESGCKVPVPPDAKNEGIENDSGVASMNEATRATTAPR